MTKAGKDLSVTADRKILSCVCKTVIIQKNAPKDALGKLFQRELREQQYPQIGFPHLWNAAQKSNSLCSTHINSDLNVSTGNLLG